MGLPGSGKTFLAKRFSKKIYADWFNADVIRGRYNDWDFSRDGIIRQVNRMTMLAKNSKKKFVVADFVCPLHEQIKIFKPDIVVWMDTIKKSRFKSMNKIFKPPKNWHVRIIEKNIDINLIKLQDRIRKYKWKNNKPTFQMRGKFQPWNSTHKKMFEKGIKKFGQVMINIKFSRFYADIKKNIEKDLVDFKERYKIIKIVKKNKNISE